MQEKLHLLIQNPNKRSGMGGINKDFIQKSSGATEKFLNFVLSNRM
ncbi:hypothetical protein CCAN11_1060001 [Capnocytophaga canimorsus]|uniref:Uncharacterized protein n=1 Tax=Capnocytophaga canimorsus TaxID=28188 RepID=A0A0B7I3X6_9FLAO|nr:hypothetical protein CCAN11_1060001 [Capnocytophaga canimorsus]